MPSQYLAPPNSGETAWLGKVPLWLADRAADQRQHGAADRFGQVGPRLDDAG
jgi:hypothetical protein